MNHARFVGLRHAFCDLHRNRHGCLQRNRSPVENVAERFALHQLHGDVIRLIHISHLENRYDIGMAEGGG